VDGNEFYVHRQVIDRSAGSLADGVARSGLTEQEKADLLAFLLATLTLPGWTSSTNDNRSYQ
jgi:hypothetical protein